MNIIKSQIFKNILPYTLLFDLLDKICVKENEFYHLTKSSFNSACFHNYIGDFCSKIKVYYHISKQHYVERKMNYKNFITVVRQICNLHNINYHSKIIYDKSTYSFEYYIHSIIIS